MRAGRLNKWVTLDNVPQNQPVAGMFTALSPSGVWADIQPLPPADDERTIRHAVSMRFHEQVSVDTRITYVDPRNVTRYLFVKGVQDVELKGVELRLVCDEVVP